MYKKIDTIPLVKYLKIYSKQYYIVYVCIKSAKAIKGSIHNVFRIVFTSRERGGWGVGF